LAKRLFFFFASDDVAYVGADSEGPRDPTHTLLPEAQDAPFEP
jgi:hypothetical protein